MTKWSEGRRDKREAMTKARGKWKNNKLVATRNGMMMWEITGKFSAFLEMFSFSNTCLVTVVVIQNS